MTSLRSGVKMGLMKKLTFYFLVSLFFITNVSADQFVVSDIKLGTKLTDYFTTAQISKYNINDRETNTPFYSYEGKYSYIEIIKEEDVFKDDYDYVDIVYVNKNAEIHYISAVTDFLFDHSEGLNECIEYRDQKISEYKRKKILKGLKKEITNLTHDFTGTKEKGVWFDSPLLKFNIGFVCLTYPKSANIDNDFRLDYNTFEVNDWLMEQKKKTSN